MSDGYGMSEVPGGIARDGKVYQASPLRLVKTARF